MDDRQRARLELIQRMRDEGVGEDVIEAILEGVNDGRLSIDPGTGIVRLVDERKDP